MYLYICIDYATTRLQPPALLDLPATQSNVCVRYISVYVYIYTDYAGL